MNRGEGHRQRDPVEARTANTDASFQYQVTCYHGTHFHLDYAQLCGEEEEEEEVRKSQAGRRGRGGGQE